MSNPPVIKVIRGMRQTGKTDLTARHTDSEDIVYISKESLELDFIYDYKDMHSFFHKKVRICRISKICFY